MSQIVGCMMSSLDTESCRKWLAWSQGKAAKPGDVGVFSWLLAHCYNGVVWGRLDSTDSRWHLSSNAAPEVSPALLEENLMEMRLFGPEAEILVWRTDSGFRGRMLNDTGWNEDSPTRPDTEARILLGDRLVSATRDGFTRVGDGTGAEHAVPLPCVEADFRGGCWPLRLTIRHYFERDDTTGAIRVAATRLVGVFKEGRR